MLILAAICGHGAICLFDGNSSAIRKEKKEKEKKEKDLAQQLRDEDKYDNDYRKRHS